MQSSYALLLDREGVCYEDLTFSPLCVRLAICRKNADSSSTRTHVLEEGKGPRHKVVRR